MAFLNRDDLKNYGLRATASQTQATRHKFHTKTASVKATVFLSHSHSDADLIDPLLVRLSDEGILVYVDWKDPTMPAVAGPYTATQLKNRIKECGKFMMLASNKALESRWVPWELGIADAQNGMNSVAIIPVQDTSKAWQGSEYIGIYSRVEPGATGKLTVIEPGKTDGIALSAWLTR